MKLLAIYAHYDADQILRPYVRHALQAWRAAGLDVVFVTTSTLDDAALGSIRALGCTVVERRPNVGFDFYSWRSVLTTTALDPYAAVLTLNSSVFGPIGSVAALLGPMLEAKAELVGVVRSDEFQPHLQSFCLLWKRPLLGSPAFEGFWAEVQPLERKTEVIARYEVPLTAHFAERGFSWAARVEGEHLLRGTQRARRPFDERGPVNPMLRHPCKVLELGGGFVKVQLLQQNPARVDLDPLRRHLLAQGYPLPCVENCARHHLFN